MWKSLNLRGFWKFFHHNKQTTASDPTKFTQPCLQNQIVLFGNCDSGGSSSKKEQQNDKKKDASHDEHGRVRHCSVSFLETIGWMGSALAISLNLKLITKSKHFPDKPATSYCQHHDQLWSGISRMLWRIAFAMPSTSITKAALPTLSINSPKKEEILTTPKANEAPRTEVLNSIDLSAKHLENVTIEYFSHLETVAGLQAMSNNPSQGFEHFQNGGRLGNPKAHFNLGVCYETGLGTKINLVKAAEHYEIASSTGHNLASYNLGIFYLEGKGNLKKDRSAALQLINNASENGVSRAQTFMGIHFAQLRNWKVAFKLLEKASIKDPEAQYYLSVCYKNGIGVDRDLGLAEIYFDKAATAGYSEQDENEALETLNDCSIDLPEESEMTKPPIQSVHNLIMADYLLEDVFDIFKKDSEKDLNAFYNYDNSLSF